MLRLRLRLLLLLLQEEEEEEEQNAGVRIIQSGRTPMPGNLGGMRSGSCVPEHFTLSFRFVQYPSRYAVGERDV
ncbi:hypothetical protein GN956_G22134 [Arapaima gigas]